MRIVAASDLHGLLPDPETIPRGDVLVLAGDICPDAGAVRQREWLTSTFADWVGELRVDRVLATWGNHDWVGLESDVPAVPGVTWLCDSGCVIDECGFWGSPWSLPFFDWAFMAEEAQLEAKWREIDETAHVVIVHGPPFGYGDRTVDGRHVGSTTLARRLGQLRVPKILTGPFPEILAAWL